MIRIESYLTHPLNVPLPRAPGLKAQFVHVPARQADGQPGVVDVEELDTLTIQRLRHHYDWRPADPKNNAKSKEDVIASGDSVIDVGMLRIRDLDKETAPTKSRKAA